MLQPGSESAPLQDMNDKLQAMLEDVLLQNTQLQVNMERTPPSPPPPGLLYVGCLIFVS
jgi:hypothetical protein